MISPEPRVISKIKEYLIRRECISDDGEEDRRDTTIDRTCWCKEHDIILDKHCFADLASNDVSRLGERLRKIKWNMNPDS